MTTPGGQLTPGDEPEIGDPPIYGVPDGAYVGDAGSPQSFKDLNTLNRDEAKRRMQQPLEGMFGRQHASVWSNGGLLGWIADALFGSGFGSPAQRLSDGMTELNNRVDLMNDISGYCGMFMTKNWTYVGGNRYRKLRFDAPYGPPKSATPDVENNRIVLTKGTWSVSLHVATAAVIMIIPGELWIRARIDVYRPDGTLYSRRWLDWHAHGRPQTAFHQVPVVAPEDGYYVEAWVANNADWMDFSGGTERTLIFVNRWDLRTDNDAHLPSPPDGGTVN